MPNVIRQNDPTSHGGKVASVRANNFKVAGTAIACVGDTCTCPIHGAGTIVEGDPHHTVNGVSVAYEGHKTSCGATLISTITTFARA